METEIDMAVTDDLESTTSTTKIIPLVKGVSKGGNISKGGNEQNEEEKNVVSRGGRSESDVSRGSVVSRGESVTSRGKGHLLSREKGDLVSKKEELSASAPVNNAETSNSSPQKPEKSAKSISGSDKYNTYRSIIQENIDYAYYREHRRDDIEMVDELVNCMLDVICTEGATVRVNGENKNREMVKDQYLKIHSMDIDHILVKYREQRHLIKHVHSYLKTMLYTVKQEKTAHYENAVRVDGVG